MMLLAASAATSSAPWWGTPLIATGSALAGVLLSLLGNIYIQKVSHHRQLARENNTLARTTAARLLREVGLLYSDALDRNSAFVTDADMYVTWAELRLVAAPTVVKAAGALVNTLLSLNDALKAKAKDTLGDRVAECTGAREAYIECVRREYEVDRLRRVKPKFKPFARETRPLADQS
ncbi:MAG TPA: hypothetical protein VNU19_19640 [Candidatus Acidoferrum sp.]|nr:hypothetical protein [Candidatus Acidoferrum sp.]